MDLAVHRGGIVWRRSLSDAVGQICIDLYARRRSYTAIHNGRFQTHRHDMRVQKWATSQGLP